MSDYHRIYINGGTYFFTLVTNGRQPFLCTNQALTRLRAAFAYTMKKHPFQIEGIVILPDHLHCILKLPEQDPNFSIRWSLIKRHFSIGMLGRANSRREKNIWQKRFWEHLIRDEDDFQRCLDYVYYNPVKHGYVDNPIDWKWGSFRRDVDKGLYEENWGRGELVPSNIKDVEWE